MVARRDKNGRFSEIGEGDSEVQTSSYKINKSWECSAHTGNIINNTVTTLCGNMMDGN